MTSKRTTVMMVRVPNETAEAIKRRAEREGKSVSSVASDMLNMCLLRGDLPEGSPRELPGEDLGRRELGGSSEIAPGEQGSEHDLAGEPTPGIPSGEAPGELGGSPPEGSSEGAHEHDLEQSPETRLRESSEPHKYGVDWSANKPVYPGKLADYEKAIESGAIRRGQFTPPSK